MDETSYQEIRYAVEGRVATITLHRPERMNAFTPRMCTELVAALDAADRDDDVRAVVVTGAGRAFCAGADLGSGGDTFDSKAQGYRDTIDTHRDGGGLVSLKVYSLKKPVIAAINGAAVGVGITMTLPMDVRIVAGGAKIGFVFARRGIVPEAASSWFLPRLVGIERAAEWVYTGRVFDAKEALEARLVSRVLPADEVLPAAQALAREIADNTSAVSVALARQLLWRMLGAASPLEAHRVDSKCIFFMGRSPDAYEGVSAFLEKRPARFVMRPSADMPPFYPWWSE
ncbi:MAG: crotonase/enoyl-CoA hydratase family protein [Thermodesulfobacteriota bacterium]